MSWDFLFGFCCISVSGLLVYGTMVRIRIIIILSIYKNIYFIINVSILIYKKVFSQDAGIMNYNIHNGRGYSLAEYYWKFALNMTSIDCHALFKFE